jgi:hypothetical protein
VSHWDKRYPDPGHGPRLLAATNRRSTNQKVPFAIGRLSSTHCSTEHPDIRAASVRTRRQEGDVVAMAVTSGISPVPEDARRHAGVKYSIFK